MTNDAGCPRCNNNNETALHVLRDCPFATEIWKSLAYQDHDRNFFQQDRRNWLLKNLASTEIEEWANKFGMAISSIWYERNKLVFDGANSQPVKVVEEIKSRCREYTKVMKKQGLARKMTTELDSLIRSMVPT
ncbi:Putative ribonuclease H protein [Arachis hypogaea]|nr:Putative ribonuclease H protein [Arachis hypogaea]